MITKPPAGFPRSCWNIYDAKPKKQYDTLEEAQELAKDRDGYEAYYCAYCKHFHIGRGTAKINRSMHRHPELEIELGVRVCAHLNMNDSVQSIANRCRSAKDKVFRKRR